jgi:hypothetical protein
MVIASETYFRGWVAAVDGQQVAGFLGAILLAFL